MSARIVIKKGLGNRVMTAGREARLEAIHNAVQNHDNALRHLRTLKDRFDSCPKALGDAGETDPTEGCEGEQFPHQLSTDVVGFATGAHHEQLEESSESESEEENRCLVARQAKGRGRRGRGRGKGKRGLPVDPARCHARLAALLHAAAGAGNLAASAKACYTFQVSLGVLFSLDHGDLVYTVILYVSICICMRL